MRHSQPLRASDARLGGRGCQPARCIFEPQWTLVQRTNVPLLVLHLEQTHSTTPEPAGGSTELWGVVAPHVEQKAQVVLGVAIT